MLPGIMQEKKKGNKMTRNQAIAKTRWKIHLIHATNNETSKLEYFEYVLRVLLQNDPCDLCMYNPPSSADGKPCSMCPACGAMEMEEEGP